MCCCRCVLVELWLLFLRTHIRKANAAYYDEIDRVKKSGVFAEIHTKHEKSLQARLAALPEEDREAARQRLTAEALHIMKALRKSSVLTRPIQQQTLQYTTTTATQVSAAYDEEIRRVSCACVC